MSHRLSNVMSILPKIDEVFYSLNSQNFDIALFTETRLKNTIPNEVINIVGYHLYRRDRINRMHDGVCMFIKDSIIRGCLFIYIGIELGIDLLSIFY